MSNAHTGQDDIDENAAAWVARKLSGDFSAQDQERLDAWLAENPMNRQAFEEYMAIADATAEIGAAARISAPANENDARRSFRLAPKWLLAGPALAASVAAAFIVALVFLSDNPVEPLRYASPKGETRALALADGTSVVLNADSALTVSFGQRDRHVALERGEAFFDVVKDEERQFLVDAGAARAVVLGTSFAVKNTPAESVISVHEGVVSVHPQSKINSPQPVRLTAGQTVAVSTKGATGAIETFEPSSSATWRLGFLLFDQTPLKDAVEELNRYFETQLIIGDSGLEKTPITGRIELDQHDVVVQSLCAALSLKAERRSDAVIVLTADD